MTMVRTVLAPLECKRCRQESPMEVQFHAGLTGPDGYRVGEPVDPENGILPGETFRGISPRYCDACLKVWQKAVTSARYKYMADLVRDGRLALCRGGGTTPMTPEELLDLGATAIDDVVSGHGAPPPPTQDWVEFSYCWDGHEALPVNRAHQDCNRTLDTLIEWDLIRSGWRWGLSTQRYNLRVYLDAGGCVRVEVVRTPAACPVCTLEPAFEEPFDCCPRCGWIDDSLQRSTPDVYGTNLMTLRQAIEAWRTGKPVK